MGLVEGVRVELRIVYKWERKKKEGRDDDNKM